MPRLTAKQRRDIARAVESATVDIYTGAEDTILRRLALDVAVDVPAELRRSLGGLGSAAVALDLTINEVNEEQTVTAPKGAKPLSELTAGLGALAGGGSGTGSQSGGSAHSQRYLDCAQAAGQDIAKLQKCARFIR